MAVKWQKNKVNENSINDGYEYERKDRPSRQQLNAIVNNSLYASNIAESVAEQISNLGANDKIEFKGSNPNLLINGDFRVNQRGETSYTGSNIYTVDRWNTQQSTIVTPTITGINLKTTEFRYYSLIRQKLEINIDQYISQYMTVSAKVRNTATQNLQLRLQFFSDSSYETRVGNINTPLRSAGVFSGSIQIPSGSKYVMVDIYKNTVEADDIDIDYIKLELGRVATPFSPRPYAEELAMCQRYYQVIKKESGLTNLHLALARNTTNGRIFVSLTQSLRTSPTIKNTNCVLFDCVTNQQIAITDNSMTVTCLSSSQCVLNASCENLTAGKMYFVSDTNGLANIELDAEIY